MPFLWTPAEDFIRTTNIYKLQQELKLNSLAPSKAGYQELFRWSIENRGAFWELMVKKLRIKFKKPYSRIVDLSKGIEFPQWLMDAEMNIADSCFNVERFGKSLCEKIAVIYQSEGGKISTLTYGELESLVNRVANGLIENNFKKGDSIAIAMPMTAEAVAIYLGVIKAGCAVVSIADSLAPQEIKTRLEISKTKAVFTQNFILRGGKKIPLYEKIISVDAPCAIVVPLVEGEKGEGLRKGDILWKDFLSRNEKFNSVSCNPNECTNILFSSGTTGEPKAIPWTHATPIKCATDAYCHHNIQPDDILCWHTNLGWMMGPWLIYATMLNGATMSLYYGAPTGRDFGGFVQNAKVTMLGLVPSLVKVWRNANCMEGLDWRHIKRFSSTGECSNPDDYEWLMTCPNGKFAGGKPVIEYCGGTEIGGGFITSTMVQPNVPATFTTPALGLDFVLMDEDGKETDNGEVFIVPPSIGLSTELLNADHHNVYYEDIPLYSPLKKGESPEGTRGLLRRHGDQIEKLPNGFYRAHGRVDDTMNLGGIKVSSAEIERVLNTIEGIHETAAIAISPIDGGPSELVIYAVLNSSISHNTLHITQLMQNSIKKNLNPLFKIHDVVIVDSLPRTASNKVMRRKLRKNYKI